MEYSVSENERKNKRYEILCKLCSIFRNLGSYLKYTFDSNKQEKKKMERNPEAPKLESGLIVYLQMNI